MTIVGLGIFAVGIGEWLNHPYQERIMGTWHGSGYIRSPGLIGRTLDLLGAILIGIGLYRLLTIV
jgi:hypothetical protein